MRKLGSLVASLIPLILNSPLSAQSPTTCTNPVGSAVCLGIPDGVGLPLNCPGSTCDVLNWDGAKFTTLGLTTAPDRIDYYFVSHNNRIHHNYQTYTPEDGWEWPPGASQVALELSEGGGHGPLTTVGLGTVLHQDGVVFEDPASSRDRDYAMYFVYQTDPPKGSAGHICVSLSEDGDSWDDPIRVLDESMASNPGCTSEGPIDCDSLDPGFDTCRIHVEAFSGFLLPNPTSSTGTAIFAGLEGRIDQLQCETYHATPPPSGATTFTSLYRATTDRPEVVENLGLLPFEGMKSPTFPSLVTSRYHFFFINLDMVYDPYSQRILISRVYPFPFDHPDPDGECSSLAMPWQGQFLNFLGAVGAHDGNAPCGLSPIAFPLPGHGGYTCPSHVGTLPMRGQIYSKSFRGFDLDSVATLLEEPWVLEHDLGRNTGWSTLSPTPPGACQGRFPVVETFQKNIGIDIDSVSFLRTPEGWLPEVDQPYRIFLGGYIDRNQACQDGTFLAEPTLNAHEYTIELPRTNLFSDGFESGTIARWN